MRPENNLRLGKTSILMNNVDITDLLEGKIDMSRANNLLKKINESSFTDRLKWDHFNKLRQENKLPEDYKIDGNPYHGYKLHNVKTGKVTELGFPADVSKAVELA